MTPFTPLTPTDIAAYLRATGWVLAESSGRWKVFAKRLEENDVELEVPWSSDAADYPRQVLRLLEDLSRLEQRTLESLQRDVRSSAYDVVKLRLKGTLQNGRIPVEHGAHVFYATRDLLLAAACSALFPARSMFSRRKPQAAMEYLRAAKFAPTEAGSFIITVETTVPPKLKPVQPSLPLNELNEPVDEDPPPFARNVGLRLESGTTRTRQLVDELGADDSSVELLASVELGVTSNLCDAISNLVTPDVAESVELAFRWSALWPSPRPPSRLMFDSNAHLTLRSMATSLREAATYDDCEVVGPVRNLTSNAVDAGGSIRLVMMMDQPAKMRRVSITLDPVAYQLAVTAHAEDKWFSCTGELMKIRGVYYLVNPRMASILFEDADVDEPHDPSPF